MKKPILSRYSIPDSVRGGLAEALTSSRSLARTVMGVLSRSLKEDTSLETQAFEDALAALRAKEEALQQCFKDVQDSASSEAISLHLGIVYVVMARLHDAMKDKASSTILLDNGGKLFESVPLSVRINDEEVAQHYLWTLEHIQRRDLAIEFLLSAASFGKLPVSAYLGVTRRLHPVNDAESRTKLLQAALTRFAGNTRELLTLAEEMESEGEVEFAIAALSQAIRIYVDRDDLTSALASCERLDLIRPDQMETVALHGHLLVELGRIPEALPKLLQAVDASATPMVRLSLAKALLLAHQPTQVFPHLDELLRKEPGNLEALCLKAETYNRLDKYDEALDAAERAIELHPGDADEARLHKGIALYGLKRFAESLELLEETHLDDPENLLLSSFKLDLGLRVSSMLSLNDVAVQAGRYCSMLLSAGSSGDLAAKPLMSVLRKLERWDDVIRILDHLLESTPESVPLVLDKSDALRKLGRQDAALLEINRLAASEEAKFVLIKAALLCDIGDFEGALELLRPVTQESAPASLSLLNLLNLRAWADQNCPGDAYALDGEQTYRRILAERSDDYWSHKGLANALLRLRRREEANEEYEIVLEFAEKMKLNRKMDPYDSILAGWCFYSTDRFKQAAEAYESGLAAMDIGIAAQFDYALVLLADTSFSAAQLQYKQSIADTRTKNPLRRCGLLYVSLSDLCNAYVLYPHIARTEDSYVSRRSLREALRQTLKEFMSPWHYLAERMDAYLVAEEADAKATRQRCVPPRIVGFHLTNLELPCAIVDPVVAPRKQGDNFYPLSYSPPLSDNKEELSAGLKVLWLTRTLMEAMGLPSPHSLADRLRWEKTDQHVDSWAAVTTLANARDILDRIAEHLIDQSVRLLGEDVADKSYHNAVSAQKAAQFALAAACDETIKYQALIGYGAAGGDTSEGLSLLEGRETGHLLTRADDLDSTVQEFKRGVESQAEKNRADLGSSIDSNPQGPPANLVEYILGRVGRIAQIEAVEAQDRSAAQAATNMWLLVPMTPEFATCRERLSHKLSSEGTFYLDDNAVLVLSREPAFYSSSVLRASGGRHLLDSFAFLRAAMRMQRSLPWLASALKREDSLQLRML